MWKFTALLLQLFCIFGIFSKEKLKNVQAVESGSLDLSSATLWCVVCSLEATNSSL